MTLQKALLTGALATAALITPVVLAAEAASAASTASQATSSVSRPVDASRRGPDPRADIRVHQFVLKGKTYILPSCQYVVNGGVYVSPSCGTGLTRPVYFMGGRAHTLPGK